MGRMYSVEFSKIAVTADQDFFELTPADDKPIAIHAIYLSQSSDLADAAEEILNIKVIRGLGTSGSAGGTSTPAVLNPIDTAAGFTCEINNTTIATSGTAIDLHSRAIEHKRETRWWVPVVVGLAGVVLGASINAL